MNSAKKYLNQITCDLSFNLIHIAAKVLPETKISAGIFLN